PRGMRCRRAPPAGRASSRPPFPVCLPLEIAAQPVKAPLPVPPGGLDPPRRVVQLPRIKPALADPALLLGNDQLGLLKDPDVLQQPGQGHAGGLAELADAGGTLGEPFQNLPPGGIRQRPEGAVKRRILNHMVHYIPAKPGRAGLRSRSFSTSKVVGPKI